LGFVLSIGDPAGARTGEELVPVLSIGDPAGVRSGGGIWFSHSIDRRPGWGLAGGRLKGQAGCLPYIIILRVSVSRGRSQRGRCRFCQICPRNPAGRNRAGFLFVIDSGNLASNQVQVFRTAVKPSGAKPGSGNKTGRAVGRRFTGRGSGRQCR
jgi:hypothetical protein